MALLQTRCAAVPCIPALGRGCAEKAPLPAEEDRSKDTFRHTRFYPKQSKHRKHPKQVGVRLLSAYPYLPQR
jgi:hypothetical protein